MLGPLGGRGVLRALGVAAGAAGITYLLGPFRFTSNEAAPMSSPHTETGAAGSLTVTNPGVVSASSGAVQFASDAAAKWVCNAASIAHAAGQVFVWDVVTVSTRVDALVGTAALGTQIAMMDTVGNARVPGAAVNGIGISGTGTYAIVRSATGRIYHLRLSGAAWKLIWVSSEVSTAAAYYAVGVAAVAGWTGSADNLRVTTLPAPWTTDTGIATNAIASPSNPQATTMEADALVECKWTPAAGETLQLDFRRTDADNLLKLVCDQAGGTIKLYTRQAGVDAELNAGKTQTWTAGTAYRIVVICDGTAVKSYVNNTGKHNTTTAVQQAATGVNLAGGATVANLFCWPRTLSGAALSTLQAV